MGMTNVSGMQMLLALIAKLYSVHLVELFSVSRGNRFTMLPNCLVYLCSPAVAFFAFFLISFLMISY